jgi:pimeloyl-ACP methyl ester carboxylesterase
LIQAVPANPAAALTRLGRIAERTGCDLRRRRLAGERELIAFDAPGAGLSQRPRLPALRGRGVVEPALAAPGAAPDLIVAGDQDPSVPLRNARLLAARLPDARLHVVKGGGHLFLLDEPQNVVGPIRAFLDED